MISKQLLHDMIKQSEQCVRNNPNLATHPFLCENIHISPLQGKGSHTLHTHTVSVKDFPSAGVPSLADIKTTKRLKKDMLCIINSADHTLSCWNKKDGFKKRVLHKKV